MKGHAPKTSRRAASRWWRRGRRNAGSKQSSPRDKIAGDEFRKTAREVSRAGRTLLGEDRLWILWQAARNVGPLGLPAAEVGSYRGGSAFLIARAFELLQGASVPVEVIDTFEGHTSSDPTAHDHPIHTPGHFGDTSFEDVREYLSRFSALTVRKGAFADISPQLNHPTYGFIHLDVDLYQPTRAGLEYFGPRMAVGGVIVLDDYGARKCPGIQRAAEEFLGGRADFQPWHANTEQLILVRTHKS
jgi:O-methyltransferase